jgi:hypothetical protein
MGFRSNIPTTSREFYYTPAGDNILPGITPELPNADPYQSITSINALVPPVDSTNRATIQGIGTYNNTLSIPRYVAARAPDTSIIAFVDATNVILGGDQTVEFGSMISFVAGGTLVESDNNVRLRCIVNAAVTTGDNSVGLRVSGVSDDSSYMLVQAELRGTGDVLLHHTASSETPITYDIGVVEFFNTDQTLITYNPLDGTSKAILSIDLCQPDSSSITTGSKVFHLIGGSVIATAGDLMAESLAVIGDGAEMTLKANSCSGKTLVEDGGQCAYVSMAIHTGDIETQGTGQMLSTIAQVEGDIGVGVGSSLTLNSDFVIGDITINGRFDCVIHNHVGVLTNNGVINGIINGVRYGNWQNVRTMETILTADSLVDQEPLALDTPIQISFGPTQPPLLDAAGSFTAADNGQYEFSFTFQYGRAGSGGVSWLFFRLLKNGTQIGTTPFVKLENLNADFPAEFNNTLDLLVGDVISLELLRDSRGNNSGGLLTETPLLIGWNPSPSASLSVKRMVIL